jgi:hypothetical protein
LIKDGDSALILYAGQSTKFDGSDKEFSIGMCDVGLPSKKTAYQIIIEKFIRAQLKAHNATKN